jgi:hypothetical protein
MAALVQADAFLVSPHTIYGATAVHNIDYLTA